MEQMHSLLCLIIVTVALGTPFDIAAGLSVLAAGAPGAAGAVLCRPLPC